MVVVQNVSREDPERRPPLTERSGDLARGAGRVVFWAVVGLVLVRGVGSILIDPTARRAPPAEHAATAWPDAEARAFAERFASTYLDVAPKRPRAHQRQVASFLTEGLSDQAAAVLPPRGPGARVALATVAREVPLGGSRARFTVATTSTTGTVRYLTVPVARDPTGGLSVDGLPSLAPPPAKGTTPVAESTALSGPDAPAIRDVVGRFLSAYVSGRGPSTLSYFLAPGTRLVQMPPGLNLLSVGQVSRDPHPESGAGVAVAVAVRVKDLATGATYPLSYRLRVVRRDRWYVSSVAGGPSA
ncbi:conjugal transfer protein [Patulibacter sp. NPDC049589]|uniref:conjugal transfer protein n=1 Tax=Patulibacter sp. NPDC049589 TaxID=3154731 RepID=UPI0034170004